MSLNISHTRELLQDFDFRKLFIEELGWSNPVTSHPTASGSDGFAFERREIAQLGGVVVFEIVAPDTVLPDAKTRAAISKEISKLHHENLLIFVDSARTKSLWYWVKRDGAKTYPRDHPYVRGQPGDLFLSKLASMVVDISELDAKGNIPVSEVALRLKKALDVERVTKRFYSEFQQQHLAFLELIDGIADERQRRWYASVLLNRLMFIYFLQRKYFLDGGNTRYLQEKLEQSRKQGHDCYYSRFLKALFFEGFAKPEKQRSPEAKKLLGQIKYLNGGLFLPHRVEIGNPNIRVPDKAFKDLFALFERYSWNLDDTPGGNDDEINPDVLGYIFEKYINQKEFGAYYTRPEITGYLCEQTIYKLVLDKINSAVPRPARKFASMAELLLNLDANLCRRLLHDVLPSLSLLDPACGSGAFLVAAMKTLINLYSAIVGKIDFLYDRGLAEWLATTRTEHPSLNYFIKKRIITDNLFGVDIMEEGAEIAQLRLFLALVASAHSVEQLEPLPNIDFNILAGNSLIGLLEVDPRRFDAMDEKKNAGRQALIKLKHKGSTAELPEFAVETTVAPSKHEKAAAFVAERNAGKFAAILKDKNKSIALYRKHAFRPEEIDALDEDTTLVQLRSHIDTVRAESYVKLNQLLLDEFNALGIQFEQATWDDAKNKEGKAIKRPLTLADIGALNPFHWGYEFDQIINERGGFDAIITNPPWEIFKPQAKEFFKEHSQLVIQRKMDIKEFEKEQTKLLRDPVVAKAWLSHQSEFPHLSAYFRSAAQYKNQISVVNGKKTGSDVNLYKLFLEQSINLLRKDAKCGIIVPTSIYTDLGATQLRHILYFQSRIGTMFGLANERFIFEGVDHRFKVCLLTFEKGGSTADFEVAFRMHPHEAVSPDRLDLFLRNSAEHLRLSVSLIRRLSPDSLSVMEFRNETDLRIAEKMIQFPLLSEQIEGTWRFRLTREFDMTNDSGLFKPTTSASALPLFEGKMIWQFDHNFALPRYWVDEKKARVALTGRGGDTGQRLDYQNYRCGIRAVASNTNERTLILSVLPPNVFCGNSVLTTSGSTLDKKTLLFLAGIFNSVVMDALLRSKATINVNMFYIYQLPVPRLTEADPAFGPIVTRAAKLICTTAEFDELAREVGLGSHKNGVRDPAARAKLRAELDGLVAHLYGLTEDEFAYILTTFPLVGQPVKDAALDAFRALAPKPGDLEISALLAAGENATVEFKSSARWDLRENKKNPAMEQVILKTVAAFLNSDGGTLLLGISDEGTVLGLEHDYQTLQKKNADGYELFLGDLLLTHYGKDLSRNLKFSFHALDGKQVGKISIQAAPRAVWVKEGADEHLYIRSGNSTRRLTTKEAIEYCKTRWKA
jgi:Putative DNA-binding domain